MTIISKTAGALSAISCIKDIHKNAMVNSKNARAKAMSDTFIATDLSAQKADRISSKDAERKNWLLENNFFSPINEGVAAVGGYLKGAFTGIVHYLPNLLLTSVALFTKKHKTVANISAIALGVMELYDFIKHSSSIGQKNDYLK